MKYRATSSLETCHAYVNFIRDILGSKHQQSSKSWVQKGKKGDQGNFVKQTNCYCFNKVEECPSLVSKHYYTIQETFIIIVQCSTSWTTRKWKSKSKIPVRQDDIWFSESLLDTWGSLWSSWTQDPRSPQRCDQRFHPWTSLLGKSVSKWNQGFELVAPER